MNFRGELRGRKIMRDKEKHYIMIRRSILHLDIAILNFYVPNSTVSKYMMQKLIEMQGEIDESTMIETLTLLHQKWTDSTSKKSVRT